MELLPISLFFHHGPVPFWAAMIVLMVMFPAFRKWAFILLGILLTVAGGVYVYQKSVLIFWGIVLVLVLGAILKPFEPAIQNCFRVKIHKAPTSNSGEKPDL